MFRKAKCMRPTAVVHVLIKKSSVIFRYLRDDRGYQMLVCNPKPRSQTPSYHPAMQRKKTQRKKKEKEKTKRATAKSACSNNPRQPKPGLQSFRLSNHPFERSVPSAVPNRRSHHSRCQRKGPVPAQQEGVRCSHGNSRRKLYGRRDLEKRGGVESLEEDFELLFRARPCRLGDFREGVLLDRKERKPEAAW